MQRWYSAVVKNMGSWTRTDFSIPNSATYQLYDLRDIDLTCLSLKFPHL